MDLLHRVSTRINNKMSYLAIIPGANKQKPYCSIGIYCIQGDAYPLKLAKPLHRMTSFTFWSHPKKTPLQLRRRNRSRHVDSFWTLKKKKKKRHNQDQLRCARDCLKCKLYDKFTRIESSAGPLIRKKIISQYFDWDQS